MQPFFESFLSTLLSLPLTLISFFFVLGVVVAVHEYGHLWTGRLFGIQADVYSIGFGKCLWSRMDKHGTEWKICLIPLGGYVKFRGDRNAASVASQETMSAMSDSERRATFYHAPLFARACTIAAGPLINIAFAALAFAGVAFWHGQPALLGKIGSVNPGTPAEAVGMKPGDMITAVNGVPVTGAEDIVAAVERSSGKPMIMTVRREEASLDLTVTPVPKIRTTADGQETYLMVGISFNTAPENTIYRPVGIGAAAWVGVEMTYKVAHITAVSIKRMVTGQDGVENLSGPVRIAAISGDYAESHGIMGLLLLIAVVSVSIGLMNLLPIPILDGGHLLLFAYEAVARKRPNKKVEQFSYGVGLACVMSLMAFATMNDIVQLAFR